MLRIRQIMWFLVILAVGRSALATEASRFVKVTSPEATARQSGTYQASAQVQRYLGFEDDSEDFTSYAFSLGFNVSERQTLSLQQSIIAFDMVDPGYSEFQFADTSLTFKQGLPSLAALPDTRFSLSAQITLPASQESQDFDIISKPSLILGASHPWNDFLSSGMRIQGRYYLNRYKTTPTDPGDRGGVRLRQAEFILNPSLDVQLMRKLKLSTSADATWVKYEDLKYENAPGSSAGADQRPALRYGLGATLEYSLYEHWSFLVGYSQGDAVEKAGGLQVVAFDPYLSRAFVGTAVSM